jgi:hypothetical protein
MFGKKLKGPWSSITQKYLEQLIKISNTEIINLFGLESNKSKDTLLKILTHLVNETSNTVWNNCENQKHGPLGPIEPHPGGVYSPFMSYKSTTKIPTESLNKIIKQFLEAEGFYDFKEDMEERFKKAAKVMPKAGDANKPNNITR